MSIRVLVGFCGVVCVGMYLLTCILGYVVVHDCEDGMMVVPVLLKGFSVRVCCKK